MREPRRDHYRTPAADDDTHACVQAAIEHLGALRGLPSHDDPGVTLHLLTSLIAETERRLPAAVAAVRDQQYSWAQIGDLLGVTRASAWQRYSSPP
ncbi:MAG: hypothetical protein ACRDY0_13095 [Acidimicrobiales bacterium]